MKKKIFSTLLMGAFFLASMSMFTSCKDYDDDINKNKSEIEALKTQIATLQSAVDANKSAIAGLDSKYASKADLDALSQKIANLVTTQALQDAIAQAKEELQKAIDGKADKADLQKLSEKVDGIDTNLNTLSKDVDGIKSALNDPETGLAAAHAQIALQKTALEELAKVVDKNKEDIAQLQKDLNALDERLTADMNDLKQRMQEAEKMVNDLNDKVNVLTLFIDRMLTGLLVKTDYMLNGIETLPVHMLLNQYVLEGVKYNEVKDWKGNVIGKNGEGTETYDRVAGTSNDLEEAYHDIWNELYNAQDFKLPLNLVGFIGNLKYNPRYKYVNMFPVGHARYTLDPSTAKIDGGSVSFVTDYKNVTETSVYGEQSRAAANTAIGEVDPVIVPVDTKLAQSQVAAGGVLDVPYTVGDKEKFINTWVKNFVLGIENANTVGGYATDYADMFDFTSWSMRAPFVAANLTPAVEENHTARSIQSDWTMVVPNLINLIALADNYPNFELAGDIKGDIPVDYDIPTPPYYRHWSRVDNGEVASNHLYPTADDAVHSIPTHQVVYNSTIDLKPFVETHAAIFGARFTRDGKLSDQELEELGLHYEYYLVDYDSNRYSTSESAHMHQVPLNDPKSSVFAPNSVDAQTGLPIVDKQEKGSVGREPIVRVELRTEDGDVVLYGYIKIQIVEKMSRIVEADPLAFEDIHMECSPGTGLLKWHQVEAGIAEKLDVSVSEFENLWQLDTDLVNPMNPSLGYGARRFVKIDGQFYDEDSYIRMVEQKYKLSDWTIDDVLRNNVDMAVQYFKIFAGRIYWTHNYVSKWDPQNRQTDVLVWELGSPYSAWSHAFKDGAWSLTAEDDVVYTKYISAPDETTGLSTVDVETYVRFVKKGTNDEPVYVKLTIPAGELKWAAGKLSNKKYHTAGYWYQFNSTKLATSDADAKEIHVNVPTPRPQTDPVPYSRLIIERKGNVYSDVNDDYAVDLTDYWINNEIKYADVDENKLSQFAKWLPKGQSFDGFDLANNQEKLGFYFTLPHVDKKNVSTDEYNFNPQDGTWTVKGWSGKTYYLALYKLPEGMADKAENYIRFESRWELNTRYGKPEYVEVKAPVERGTEIRVIKIDMNDGNGPQYVKDIAATLNRIPTGVGLNPDPALCTDAEGIQGYWLVRLTNKDITVSKIPSTRDASTMVSKVQNKYMIYWRDWISEDILNVAGHKQMGEKQSFTAYLEVVYDECYELFAGTSKYFNARFVRPVNFAPLSISVDIDAKNNGVDIDFTKFIENGTNRAFTDWRDQKCERTGTPALWDYYSIHLDDGSLTSKGGSYGGELAYVAGTPGKWQFTDLLLNEIRTDQGRTDSNGKVYNFANGYDYANRVAIESELPIASKYVNAANTYNRGLKENATLDLSIQNGKLHYNNNNQFTGTFHIYVPIHWSYCYGDEFEDYTYNFFRGAPYTYGIITVKYTQGNPGN